METTEKTRQQRTTYKGERMARNREIGALWKRTSKAGNKFLSGVINNGVFGEVAIAVFERQEKRTDNSPDYVIIASDPLPSQGDAAKIEDDEDLPF
jgi:uncharacterized protein (DUF736 family)